LSATFGFRVMIPYGQTSVDGQKIVNLTAL